MLFMKNNIEQGNKPIIIINVKHKRKNKSKLRQKVNLSTYVFVIDRSATLLCTCMSVIFVILLNCAFCSQFYNYGICNMHK